MADKNALPLRAWRFLIGQPLQPREEAPRNLAATPETARLALGLRRLRPVVPVLAIGALLALLPFSTCLLRLAAGIPCPACGLTRSMLALARLDLAASLRWHPLGVALLALFAAVSAAAFVASEPAWRRLVKLALNAASVGLLLVWALRFAGLFGGPVP